MMKVISDKYNGITIDPTTLPEDITSFETALTELISQTENKNLLWLTLPITKSAFIPVLIQNGFVFFECKETKLTLFKKLTNNPVTPTATNHTVGVGAFIQDGDNLVVVKDRINRRFKLPGGYMNSAENIRQAAIREVLEETGIHIKVESIISLAHFYPSQFDNSNIYMVCRAIPLSKEIIISDTHEIIDAKWISIDEYIYSKTAHPFNKKIVETALRGKGLVYEEQQIDAKDKPKYEYEFFS
ncbi:MAG: NUDIX domain-containing protein [Fibrobacteria bacterium]|nr:NUDIX domain-containing protein [Fibrobacteria bacterium]